MTAFEDAWNLTKSDFVLSGKLGRTDLSEDQPDAYGYHFRNPVDYTFTPKGSGEPQTITDKNFTLLGPIAQREMIRAYKKIYNDRFREPEDVNRLRDMILGNIPFDHDDPIVREFEEMREPNLIEQTLLTPMHEAGHEAHQRIDPGYAYRGNDLLSGELSKDPEYEAQRKFGLFDYDTYFSPNPKAEASLKEYIAYMSEFPHDEGAMLANLIGHPDVGARYANRATKIASIEERKKRNLENAILDSASRYLGRTAYGVGQFGTRDSSSAKKRMASKDPNVRALLRQVRRLDEDEISSYENLPQSIKDGIANLKMRNAMTDFHEKYFKTPYVADAKRDAALQNLDLFLEHYDAINTKDGEYVEEQTWGSEDKPALYHWDHHEGYRIPNPNLVAIDPWKLYQLDMYDELP